MRSPRRAYYERIRSLLDRQTVDLAAKVRVYRRGPDGKAEPDYWLPKIYGGRFDPLVGEYVSTAEDIKEIRIHPGQLALVESISGPWERVLAVGAKGGGKTMGACVVAALMCAERPCGIGGVVAPTHDRLLIVWRKFLDLVTPLGWVEGVRPGDMEVVLKNRAIVQFVSAKRQSSSLGSPIAGRDWQWAVEEEQQNIDDDSLREVDARGRIASDYRVFSTATNEPLQEFQLRLQEYRSQPKVRIVQFGDGTTNVFTPLEHWERLKRRWSKSDWEREIEGKDVPIDGRVYPMFSQVESVKPRPQVPGLDITEQVTVKKLGRPYKYVVGIDFGSLVTASVILKAYLEPATRETLWWAIDEIVSIDKGTDWHGQALLERYKAEDFIAVGDPHVSLNSDKSDYTILRRMGINVMRANHTKIPLKHRISMVNAMFCAADGKRRLFLDTDERGKPVCRKMAESAYMLTYSASGKPDAKKKSLQDLTHYMDDVGYALFPFEKFRGTDKIEMVSSGRP